MKRRKTTRRRPTRDRSATVGRDANGGDVVSVSDQLVLDIAFVQVPDKQARVMRPGYNRAISVRDDDAADEVLVFDKHLPPHPHTSLHVDTALNSPPPQVNSCPRVSVKDRFVLGQS